MYDHICLQPGPRSKKMVKEEYLSQPEEDFDCNLDDFEEEKQDTRSFEDQYDSKLRFTSKSVFGVR